MRSIISLLVAALAFFVPGSLALGQGSVATVPIWAPDATLTYASAITWNVATSPNAAITATGPLAITVSNPISGNVYRLKVIQGGSGANAVTFTNATTVLSAPTSTAIGNLDIFDVKVIGSTIYAQQEPKAQPALGFSIGVRLAGMEFSIPDWADFVPTNATLDYYHSKNMNSWLRLSFDWESMQPTLGGALNSTQLSDIAALAAHAASNGQTLCLDLHNYGQYNGINIGAPGGPTIAQFAEFWSAMSTYFKGMAGIGCYELMNEPHIDDNVTWPAAAQAAVTAIRGNDDSTQIMVDGDQYAAAMSWPTYNNSLWISDPDNNVVYSAHGYADDNSGTYATSYSQSQLINGTSPALMIGRFQTFVQWCQANGARCQIGEFNIPWFAPDSSTTAVYDPRWLAILQQTLGYLQTIGMPITLNAGGGYWSYNYPQLLDQMNFLAATGSSGSQTLPASQMIDSPEWAVLTQFTGSQQPISYGLSGPSSGTHGDASAAFTVAYQGGTLTAPLTITPNDLLVTGTYDTFSTTWLTNNATMTANAAASPDGYNNGTAINEGTSDSTHGIAMNATVHSGASVTVTALLQQGTQRYAALDVYDGGSNHFNAVYDLQGGTVTQTNEIGTGVVTASSITSVEGGWYLCSVTGNIPSVTSYEPFIYTLNTGTPGSNGYSYQGAGDEIYVVDYQMNYASANGTFSPSSVTLPAGQINPSATFTYTETDAGTRSISTTNSAGPSSAAAQGTGQVIIDPAGVSYTGS